VRIAVTNHHRKLAGGTETYLDGVLPELEVRGHEVKLFHEAESGEPAIRASLHTRDWGQLASFHPDLIFNHGLQSPEREFSLADVAPVVHFAHNYHGTCISGEKTRKFPAPAPCGRRFGLPCLGQYLPRRCGGLNPLVMLRDYRTQSGRLAAMRRARAVVTASRHMEAEYRRNGLADVYRAPLFVSQNAAPLIAAPAGPFRILFAGRMTRIKGARYLAEAVRLTGISAEITFAGDGPERAELERLYPDANFPGWISQAELRRLAQSHHLFAMPSIWPEPFGLSGLELALPVAAFAVGGIPDWLTDGVNGYVAPADPPTAAGLAQAILACRANPGLRDGAWRVSQEFTLPRHMDALMPVLEAACAS